MSTKIYDVTVRRDGRWWFVDVPELDTAGQARTLSAVDEVAREVIGLTLDVAPETVSVSVSVDLPGPTEELLAQARQLEMAGWAEVNSGAEFRRKAVRSLVDSGISQADAARALGLSRRRVSQLVG